MGLFKCIKGGVKWDCFAALFLIGILCTAFCTPLLSAQDRTINLRTLDDINRNQLQLGVQPQDTSNLELLRNFNIQSLQLQPSEKTVLNIDRTISRVDAGNLTQVNPDILANLNRQEIYSFPELH